MPRQERNFLRRWSRLKREVSAKRETIGKADVPAVPPELPPLDGLSFESDFAAFMRAKVDDRLRRAALKKLFADPRFNVMDGLDVYIDDYSKDDPIPPGMLAQLEHARTTLFGPQPDADAGKPAPLSRTTTPAEPADDRAREDTLPT